MTRCPGSGALAGAVLGGDDEVTRHAASCEHCRAILGELGATRAALAECVGRRFGRATLVGADPELDAWLAAVAAFVAEPAGRLHLPLDVRGTAFQQRVWRALQAIPSGATLSYAELARRVGMPRGARAVARAVATNPLALAIPCHRVVASDGGIGGYRWGVARKRRLLARERAAK